MQDTSEIAGVPGMLVKAAMGGGRLTIVDLEGERSWLWSDVHELAERAVVWFEGHNLGPGAPVLIVSPTSLQAIVAIRAAWLGGLSVTIASPPTNAHNAVMFNDRIDRISSVIRPGLTIVSEDCALSSAAQDRAIVIGVNQWFNEIRSISLSRNRVARMIDKELLAVIQPTSGTTGPFKAVTVPHRCLESNHISIASGLDLQPQDRFMSWLPLSHDMGLIGMLGVPMMFGHDLVITDPSYFAARPADWMGLCSVHASTITCGPNSTYGFAGLMMSNQERLDLSCLRIAINGSEPVEFEVFQNFLKVGAGHGLKAEVAFPVYGLAEATLAVTFPVPGAGLQYDQVEREALSRGEAVPTTMVSGSVALTTVGSPVSGMQVRIVRDSQVLENRQVGEIEICGNAVTPGYLGKRPMRPRQSNWLSTGDLGYWTDSQLVVCGRSKDIIILGGRNIYPEDLERVSSKVDGVWRGKVAAFGVPEKGRERIIVLAESSLKDYADLKRQIFQRVLTELGVSIMEVRVVEPRSLPKTVSGKIARSKCREAFLTDRL